MPFVMLCRSPRSTCGRYTVCTLEQSDRVPLGRDVQAQPACQPFPDADWEVRTVNQVGGKRPQSDTRWATLTLESGNPFNTMDPDLTPQAAMLRNGVGNPCHENAQA
jgi:hypothetical protein